MPNPPITCRHNPPHLMRVSGAAIAKVAWEFGTGIDERQRSTASILPLSSSQLSGASGSRRSDSEGECGIWAAISLVSCTTPSGGS